MMSLPTFHSIQFRKTILILSLFSLITTVDAQWVERNVNIPYGGSIAKIYHCGGTDPVFAATAGGIYKTISNGSFWTNASAGLLDLEVRSISATNCINAYFAATANGLFKTADSGNSWNLVNTGQTGNIDYLFSFSPLVFIVVNGSLSISNDEGVNWSDADPSAPMNIRTMTAALEGCCYNFYAQTASGIFKSTDLGFSWISTDAGIPSSSFTSLVAVGSDVFVGTTDGGIFHSNDGGSVWNTNNTGLNSLYTNGLFAANGRVFAAVVNGAVNELYVTNDSGANWISASSGLSNNPVGSISQGQFNGSGKIFAGTPVGIYQSTDNGANWQDSSSGIQTNSIRSIARIGSTLFAGILGSESSAAKGIYRSTNNGDTWVEINNGMPDPAVYSIASGGNGIFIGTSANGVFYSGDNGDTWQAKSSGLPGSSIVFSVASNGGQMYAGTGSGLFISGDNGDSWSPSTTGLTSSAIRDLLVTPAGVFVATAGGGIFISTNNGTSWSAVNTGLPSLQIRSLALKGTILFAGTVNNGIFKSTNNGGSWVPVNSGLSTAAFMYGLKVSGGNLFAGGFYSGSSQIYRSTDDGANWVEFGDADFHPNIYDLEVNGNTVYAASSGQGVWIKVLDATEQPTNLTFSNVKATTLNGSFQAATGDPDGYVVLFSENVAPNLVPADGVEYAYNQEVGTVSGNKIYNLGQGKSTDFNLIELAPGGTFYFKVYSYNGSGSTIKYLTASPLEGSVTTSTDITPPQVIANATPSKIAPNTNIPVSVNLSDAGSGIASAKIQYRPVAASLPNNYIEADLVPPSTGANYTLSIPAALITELGVEYKFLLTDNIGNDNSANQILYKTRIEFQPGTDQSLVIPYTDPGTDQSNYRIIAMPIDLDSKSVNNVFNAVFGGYDPTAYTLYRWEGGPDYVELNDNSPLELGKGYWYLTPISTPVSIGPGQTADVTTAAPFKITLQPGWNQIGNPYNFDISWTDVVNANPANAADFGNNSKVRVFRGVVSDEDELHAFEGGFVRNTNAAAIQIDIPVAKNVSINGRKRSDNNSLRNPLDQKDWEVVFNLSSGHVVNSLGGFGMRSDASFDFDKYDDFNLPPFFDLLEVRFPKERVGMKYAKDVVPASENHVWDFTVESTIKSDLVTLTWDNSYFGEAKNIWLLDVDSHELTNMAEINQYTFPSKRSRNFKVAYGEQDFVTKQLQPDRLVLFDPFPNPFSNTTTIGFAIPHGNRNQVNVQVFNHMGVGLVSELVEVQGLGGKWSWNSLDNPSGLYFVNIRWGNQSAIKKIIKQ